MPSGMYDNNVVGILKRDLRGLLYNLICVASSPMVNPVRPFPMGIAIKASKLPVGDNGPNRSPAIIPAIKPVIRPDLGPA